MTCGADHGRGEGGDSCHAADGTSQSVGVASRPEPRSHRSLTVSLRTAENYHLIGQGEVHPSCREGTASFPLGKYPIRTEKYMTTT